MLRRRTALGTLAAMALTHASAQVGTAPSCQSPWPAPAFALPLLPTPAGTAVGRGSCSTLENGAGAGMCSQQFLGRWLYLDFWASWCAPCRLSIPWMNRLQARSESAGLQVVGINLDSHQARAMQFLSKTPASFTMLWDSTGKSARDFQVQAMPMSYVIDPLGRIVSAHRGFSEDTAPSVAWHIEQVLRGHCLASHTQNESKV